MIYERKETMLSYYARPLLVALFLLCCFLMVWLRSSITTAEYHISELEKEKLEVMKERKSLIARRAEALSSIKAQQIAMNRLGLTSPDRTKIFHIKRDGGNVPYDVSFKIKR